MIGSRQDEFGANAGSPVLTNLPSRWLACAFAVVALAYGAHFVRAEDPVARLLPAQDAPAAVKPADVPGPTPKAATAPPAPLSPPSAPVEEIWNNLVSNHQAYVCKFGGVPSWLQPDPCPGPGWHVFADGGFYMVQTYFSSNPAFLIGQRLGTGAKATTITQARDFDYGLNFLPRVTLGVVGDNGLGVRAAWWLLNESQAVPPFRGAGVTLNPIFGAPPVPGVPGVISPSPVAQQLKIFGENLGFDNHVQLQVWDWEAFRDWRGDGSELIASGGVRYAWLSQGYRAFRNNTGSAKSGTTTFTLLQDADTLGAGRSFAGLGPTGAVELRRALGWMGFSVYGMARGSVLFGREHEQAFELSTVSLRTTVGTAAPKTTTTSSFAQSLSGRDHTLPIVDAEVGVNWTMPYGRSLVFTQLGFMNQSWFGGGSATNGGELGFFGLHFSAGVNY
jgi:hypothetical protein